MSDRYAVIGNPISHSQSPQIHAEFALQTCQSLEYSRLLGDLANFAGDVRQFFADAGRGLNVTVPFKVQAWALADERSPQAELAGAVNTLTQLSDGRLRGDNTDGVGLIRDLTQNHGFAVRGAQVLLLGAGGAAQGVIQPLLAANVAQLVIANRTASKAVELAAKFAFAGAVSGCALEALAGRRFDLIINATSAGLTNAVPAIPHDCLNAGGWIYDMLYSDQCTAFQRWGLAHGAARAVDGLGMLVEQAAESFWLWRGVRPNTAPIITQLRGAAAVE